MGRRRASVRRSPAGRLIDDTLVQVADDIDVITEAAGRCGLDRLAVLCAGELIDVDVELSVPWALADHDGPDPPDSFGSSTRSAGSPTG